MIVTDVGSSSPTRKESADVGFAQDPDADRLAIVDENGAYIGEEYTLALAAMHLFITQPGPMSANLSTSRMIDVLAERAGEPCAVHRSAVGEANVVEMMRKTRSVIGGSVFVTSSVPPDSVVTFQPPELRVKSRNGSPTTKSEPEAPVAPQNECDHMPDYMI